MDSGPRCGADWRAWRLDRDVRLQLPGVEGHFYPADLPASKMLPYYASRFRTVEINYTFYRMPTAKAVDGWLAATPDTFRFTLKAPKRITHDALKDVGDLVRGFCDWPRASAPRLARCCSSCRRT